MSNEIVDELEDILEAEKTALLTGGFEQLDRISQHRNRLFQSLAHVKHTDPAALARISAKIKSNHALLTAAMAGIADATKRLDEIARGSAELVTYDHRGKKTDVVLHKSALERRL